MNSGRDTSVGGVSGGLATAIHAGFVLWKKELQPSIHRFNVSHNHPTQLVKSRILIQETWKAFKKVYVVVAPY